MQFLKTQYVRATSKLSGLTKSWVKARDGIAAMEFTLVAPVLIAVYFGVVEITHVVSTHRKVSQAAAVVSDLAAQMDYISKEDLQNIMTAGVIVMEISPEDYSKLGILVGSFKRESDGTLYVAGWSRLGNVGGTTFTDEERLNYIEIQKQTAGATFATLTYEYEPVIWKLFSKNKLNLRDTGVHSPRSGNRLDFERNLDRFNRHSFLCNLSTSGAVSCA